MKNITDDMMKSNLESPESDDRSTSFQSKTLLDLPVEVIEMILSRLNFEDKKNFGLTCKKHNEILSNCANLWRNVWLQIKGRITLKSSELTRKYMSVDVDCDDFSEKTFNKLLSEGIMWARLAGNLRALVLDLTHFPLSRKSFTSILPYIKNLVHWSLYGAPIYEDFDESIAIDQQSQLAAPVVEMKKLKYLEMEISVFLILNGRFINFSMSPLKELILCGHYDYNDDVVSKESEKVLARMVECHKDLKMLKLNSKYGVFFDKPLKLDVQLREIDLAFQGESLNAQQQDNMCNFLDSQETLERQTFKWRGPISDRILEYQMRLLNSAVITQRITFQNRRPKPSNSWHVDYESLEIAINSTNFLSYPHQENFNTLYLHLEIDNISAVLEVEALITRICEKFPNLKDLTLQIVDSSLDNFEALASINLSNLRRLEKLESLELKYFTSSSSSYRLLDNITIPSLKKFTIFSLLYLAFNNGSRYMINLKNFMTRHVNLNHMEFELPSHSVTSESYLTRIFADSGFDMTRSDNYEQIILTKGQRRQ